MPPPSPLRPVLSQERLQEIRDADAAVGDDENLRWFTATTTHRRELLGHIDMLVLDAEARSKRFITGEVLYAMYEALQNADNSGVDSWVDLPQHGIDAWEQMAENINVGFRA